MLFRLDKKTENKSFQVGTHLILGLPAKSREMMIDSFKILGKLPIKFLKIHQLQIVKNTILAFQFSKMPFKVLSQEEYIEIMAEGLQYISPNIVIQRVFSTAKYDNLIAPFWDKHPSTTPYMLEQYMLRKNIYQGLKINLQG